MRFPSRNEPLIPVDERLVAPETRAEIIDGKVHFSPPADEPHATVHLDLGAVLRAHIAPGYIGALDMLTRTSKKNDFAPDASVFPEARDPETGGRRLEELAFEIASAQALGVPTTKARELVRRGVRRVFCLLVKKRRTLEWSRETNSFMPLADSSFIEDRCFIRPLPVRALLDPAEADRAIVDALVARESPAIMALREAALEQGLAQGREAGRAEGRKAGRKASLLVVLSARSIPVTAAARAQIDACDDEAQLDRWLQRAAVAQTLAEVFKD